MGAPHGRYGGPHKEAADTLCDPPTTKNDLWVCVPGCGSVSASPPTSKAAGRRVECRGQSVTVALRASVPPISWAAMNVGTLAGAIPATGTCAFSVGEHDGSDQNLRGVVGLGCGASGRSGADADHFVDVARDAAALASIWATRSSIRVWISVRIGRMSSTPCPAGSSTTQSR